MTDALLRDYKQTAILLAVLILALIVAPMAQAQGVNFSKVDAVGTGFVKWLRGPMAIVLFTAALALLGYMASVNRISWAWVGLVVIGAFFVFGGPTIVTQLKSVFS